MDYYSVRFFFGSRESAIEALLYVLRDARKTKKEYSIGSLSSQQIMSSGLLLYGEVEHLISPITEIPGTSYYYD